MSAPPSPGGGAGGGAAAPGVVVPTPGLTIPAGLNTVNAALIAAAALQNAGMGAIEHFSENLYEEDINL
eukprot:13390718-Ditylum_brightwellii.AAC.1